MRWIFLGVGGLAVLVGLVWMGQGTGVFPYPAQSFMIDQRPWVWRGALVVLAGAAAMWFSRKPL